jgi:glycosyltransferase involved in cell wall biosynthesis
LNVLLITQYFPPDLGGVATRTSNLAKGLALNGCNVTVITAFPHYPHGKIPRQYKYCPIKVEHIGQIKVIRTLMPPIKSQGFFKRLLLMGSFATSALFALPWICKTEVVWGTSWVPGTVYSKIKRTPLVLDVCDLTIEDLPMLNLARGDSLFLKIASTIYRFFYVKGDAVAPISPGYLETIAKKYCVKESKIHVIEVGVDTTEFKDSHAKVNAEDSVFKVIYAGVLGVGYDFEHIFEAAKLLKEKNVNVEFIIHGNGECLESIRSRIKDLNLANVKLSDKLLGSRKEVASFLNKANALILPLKDYGAPYPGIPSKLYEYQAVGKPIICCAEGEPAKYISKSNSGIVVKPEDAKALSEALVFLVANPEIAFTMGKNGRKHIEREVTVTAIGAKVKALFVELTEDKLAID